MRQPEKSLIGVGLYSVAEAALLTGVPAATIRRWHAVDGQTALSFCDLMEVRFVHALRRQNASWAALRAANRTAAELLGDRPFARKSFQAVAKRIFARSGAPEIAVDPALYRGIEFAHDEAVRWHPMYPKKTVVLDPARSFGRPITSEGVATDILAAALDASGGDIGETARWYEVAPSSVRAAAAFEARLRPVSPTAAAA